MPAIEVACLVLTVLAFVVMVVGIYYREGSEIPPPCSSLAVKLAAYVFWLTMLVWIGSILFRVLVPAAST